MQTPDHTPRLIPLSLIVPSPFQHRKRFDESKLRELADSIEKHGQIDDALVRPIAGSAGSIVYELIAGERRLRACELADVGHLRCKVREMSDDEAMELVIIQQVQHEEWSPTEEAAGYAALLSMWESSGETKRFTLESLSVRVGKSVTHIRRLLAVLETPEEIRAAVDEGAVSPHAAAMVGMIAEVKQRELAARMVLHPDWKTSPLTVLETGALIAEKFQRSLRKAPFKLKDAKLLPEAGSCEACPFRTGNMPELSGLMQGHAQGAGGTSGFAPDVCTRPECYVKKCQAVEGRIKAEAVMRGCELMEDEVAERLFGADGELLDNSGYVDRDGKPDPTLCFHYNEDRMPTWRKLLIKAEGGMRNAERKVRAWLARNPESGEFCELIKWEEAVRAINEACRDSGEEEFFKAECGGRNAESETLKPGDNIMIPDEAKDEMWDEDEQRRTTQAARDKVRADGERRRDMMGRIQVTLLDVIRDGAADKVCEVMTLFTEHQLQFVGCDEVIDEMCALYGLQPETEDSLNDLMAYREKMNSPQRLCMLIMIMVRRLSLKFGSDSESVQEWREVLGIKEKDAEPEPEASRTWRMIDEGTDADALAKAIHHSARSNAEYNAMMEKAGLPDRRPVPKKRAKAGKKKGKRKGRA